MLSSGNTELISSLWSKRSNILVNLTLKYIKKVCLCIVVYIFQISLLFKADLRLRYLSSYTKKKKLCKLLSFMVLYVCICVCIMLYVCIYLLSFESLISKLISSLVLGQLFLSSVVDANIVCISCMYACIYVCIVCMTLFSIFFLSPEFAYL